MKKRKMKIDVKEYSDLYSKAARSDSKIKRLSLIAGEKQQEINVLKEDVERLQTLLVFRDFVVERLVEEKDDLFEELRLNSGRQQRDELAENVGAMLDEWLNNGFDGSLENDKRLFANKLVEFFELQQEVL